MAPIRSLLRGDSEDSTAVDALASTAEDAAGDDRSSGSRFRKALVGLGLLGAAAVLFKRRRDLPASAEELRGPAPAASDETDAVSIDLDSSAEDEASAERDSRAGGEASDGDESDAEEGDATGAEIDSVDDELGDGEDVSEAVEERSVEDAHEEPAEPGEVHVDDEVVEEVADEGEETSEADEESETDETGGNEETHGGDEGSDEANDDRA
jgi:polyhydroxyalkanoate synthase